MHWTLVLASLGVGIVVGLTGMGGGALMTPMLVLFFGVAPLTAVSNDLVASAIMKPVGSAVHLKRGTVRLDLVKWLALGSVPMAFLGVVLARTPRQGPDVQDLIQKALAVALVIAAVGLFVRAYMRLAERAGERDGRARSAAAGQTNAQVGRSQTVLIGAVGGLVVGLTSVGSGSLIIIALMMLYPTTQAPANWSAPTSSRPFHSSPSAAFGHILFGDFKVGLTASLLAGCIPGTYIGARLWRDAQRSHHPPGTGVRPAGLGVETARREFQGHRDRARPDARPGGADLDGDPSPARLPRARSQRTPNRSRIRAGRTLAGRTRARCEQPRRGGGCAAKGADGMIVHRD